MHEMSSAKKTLWEREIGYIYTIYKYNRCYCIKGSISVKVALNICAS